MEIWNAFFYFEGNSKMNYLFESSWKSEYRLISQYAMWTVNDLNNYTDWVENNNTSELIFLKMNKFYHNRLSIAAEVYKHVNVNTIQWQYIPKKTDRTMFNWQIPLNKQECLAFICKVLCFIFYLINLPIHKCDDLLFY